MDLVLPSISNMLTVDRVDCGKHGPVLSSVKWWWWGKTTEINTATLFVCCKHTTHRDWETLISFPTVFLVKHKEFLRSNSLSFWLQQVAVVPLGRQICDIRSADWQERSCCVLVCCKGVNCWHSVDKWSSQNNSLISINVNLICAGEDSLARLPLRNGKPRGHKL